MVARNELLAVEEFAESLWARYAKEDRSDGWRSAELQAHGAYMFRSFMGGVASRQSQNMLDDLAYQCSARAELAHAAEVRARIVDEDVLREADAALGCYAPRKKRFHSKWGRPRNGKQTGSASTVLLAVVACLVLVFGVAPPVARDALSVHVVTCPAPSDPAPSASPAVLTDTI